MATAKKKATKKKTTKKKVAKKPRSSYVYDEDDPRLKFDENFHPKSYVALCNKGLTLAEICAEWCIARDTLWRWRKEMPGMKEATSIGREKREAYFVRMGKGIALGKIKNNNVAAYIWLTKVCLNWSEDSNQEKDDTIEDMDWGD